MSIDAITRDLGRGRDTIILGDTEFVWSGQGDRSNKKGEGVVKEIFQVGFIRVDLRQLIETASVVLYTKGIQLNDHAVRITGVTQEEVDRNGVSFGTVCRYLADWFDVAPVYCYGHDMELMRDYAEYLSLPFPLPYGESTNICNFFSKYTDPSKYMSSTIPGAFGGQPSPRAHDALHDARTILEGLRALYAQIS